MRKITRRELIGEAATLTTGGLLMSGCATFARQCAATDLVSLGGSGIRTSRLGMGLGTNNGRIQVAQGEEAFRQLVRYAFDRGLRCFDCAPTYRTFSWLGAAIQELPRAELCLISKIGGNPDNPMKLIEEQLRTYRTSYIDCMLVHCAVSEQWPAERERVMEAISLAREQGKVRACGVSCHSLPALRVAAVSEWVEVNLVRLNPQGVLTDTETQRRQAVQNPIEPVVRELETMARNGHGVIAMKLIGEGRFKEPAEREHAMRFAMSLPAVDAAVIGFGAVHEVDEALIGMNRALQRRTTAPETM